MTIFFIIFMSIILGLVFVMYIIYALSGRKSVDDSQYYDDNENHIYYDRSFIEKRNSRRDHIGASEMHKMKRLFKSDD